MKISENIRKYSGVYGNTWNHLEKNSTMEVHIVISVLYKKK